jgi:RimJ/RimL family protein N-acetyltransferase
MALDLSIRPLELVDFAPFLEIQREALLLSPELYGSDYEWFESLSILSKEQRYEKYMNFPYQYILGAFAPDGSIGGMIGFTSENRLKTRHKCHLWGLFVRPEYRGKGLATQLIQSVLDTAQNVLDIEQVQLTVSTQNEASYGLYLRLGFTVFGTELHAMKIGSSYVDEYHMVKFLK